VPDLTTGTQNTVFSQRNGISPKEPTIHFGFCTIGGLPEPRGLRALYVIDHVTRITAEKYVIGKEETIHKTNS